MHLISVIPRAADSGHASMCQGTKVVTADGSEIGGITRIELVCEVNNIWRAVVHLNPHMKELHGIAAEFVMDTPPEVEGHIDATNLQSTAVGLRPSQADRIEAKLDALLKALAEDEVDEPTLTLDGSEAGGERDTSREL